jgi:ribosomal protein S18 acetylase RimI-like enzyme
VTAAWHIRPLGSADLAEYRRLRLAALRAHPEAFGSSWEEESAFDDATFLRRITSAPPSLVAGGFLGTDLVGMASLVVLPRVKQRHKGLIYGVYVEPNVRRCGLARGLMDRIVLEARQAELLLLQLAVTARNTAARRLYAEMGFTTYGVESRALKLGGMFIDEELMVLDLA